ncbi:insertion sequence protein [Yersinia similis]|nr:insertion sequence protein [Yersinia similis]
MAKVDVKGPFSGQTHLVKKHGPGRTGHQRYRCQACRRSFQLEYPYRACHPGMKEKIVDLAMNNSGIRDTARALHISINAVMHILKNSRRSV